MGEKIGIGWWLEFVRTVWLDRKRPAMPTDFSKRSRGRERRHKRRYVSAEQSRSLSPEIWRDEHRESDIVRHNYRSFSSESDESSTSDEEGTAINQRNCSISIDPFYSHKYIHLLRLDNHLSSHFKPHY